MTVTKIRSNTPPVKELLARDKDFLKPLIQATLQEVLEAEMTEALGGARFLLHRRHTTQIRKQQITPSASLLRSAANAAAIR